MSAPNPTPALFASLLGINSSNWKTYVPKIPSKQQCELLVKLFIETMCMTWKEPQRRAFSEELASYYYPQFLRFYNDLPLDTSSEFFAVLTTLAFFQGGLAVGGRFVREHREDASSHWISLLERFATISEDLVKRRPDPAARSDTFHSLLLLFKVSLQNIFLFIPEDYNIPLPSETTIQKLQARLPLFESLLPPNQLPLNRRQAWSSFDLGMLAHLVLIVKNGCRMDDGGVKVLGTFPWVSCQLAVGWKPDERNIAACEKSREGETMMGCARCRMVRYCSRKHQKIDWPRHKQFCFPPAW
ncbi:hypothetical protein BDY24DRAFT_25604 [Mrakia frigida]|uniref:zinc finger MYND domain-containing protein n=1 Tax=Mrakia frigida TaxID=29902 RepID=UPI003FCC06E4